MKQTTLFILMLLASAPSLFAQDSGTKRFLIGGSLGIYSSSNNNQSVINGTQTSQSENSEFGFSINPYVGKYVNKKWIIGVGLLSGWEHAKTVAIFSGNETTINATSISPSLFARYLINPGDKLVIQLSPSASFSYNQIVRDSGSETKTKVYSGGIGVGPLLSYALSDKINLIGRFGSLSFTAGSSKSEETGNKADFNNFNLDMNLRSIGLGLEINL